MIFAANWKMHHGPQAGRELVKAVLARVRSKDGRTLLFFPPAPTLPAVVDAIAGRHDVAAGMQNIYFEPKGAFTGETSASIAAESGAKWVLVGHSERRHKFGETDQESGKKVAAALASGLRPMLCVGEKIEERKADQTEAVVLRQLEAGLAGLDAATVARVVIAYEPVWAIGTGRTATSAQAQAAHAFLRGLIARRSATIAGSVRILYGGSVKPDNALELFACPDVDGGLIGGASLKSGDFLAICAAAQAQQA